MKKIISLLLALVLLFGAISINLCANAKGWLDKVRPIEFNSNYTMCWIGKNMEVDYDAFSFSIPVQGKVSLNISSEYKDYISSNWTNEFIVYYIYSSSNTNEYLLKWNYTNEDSNGYNSALGLYYESYSATLPAGDYYLVIEYDFDLYGNKMSGKTYDLLFNYKMSLPKPSGFKCTARSTSAEKVTWNKVAGVTGYQVQISNNGGTSWANYYNTSSNSYTFKGLTAGGKYKFRVRAYKDVDGTRYYSGWSSTLCSCAKPANVTLKSVSSPKKTQIKTTWAKAGGTVSGYQIYYGKNASFSSLAAKKNVSGKSSTSYTGKNFTKGRTYYVKVRTYTVFNGVTYYGAWSATKKVKSK